MTLSRRHKRSAGVANRYLSHQISDGRQCTLHIRYAKCVILLWCYIHSDDLMTGSEIFYFVLRKVNDPNQ